ncbi:histidine kinase [Teredinibacter turnerae]|uniref:spermidine synthase n=1 Tax=Teredinibacter turnerae TaxID=2426 RepID=UPI0030D276BA
MAIKHTEIKNGVRYEIRTAGASVRLYTNGVFHSQWNPNNPLIGSLWDLFLLPIFLLSPGTDCSELKSRLARALVLGVGGGAAINQLLALHPECIIDGVDLDQVHLRLAKRYFGLGRAGVNLVCQDAELWLKSAASEPYDYVLEDLFRESDRQPGEAVRCFECDAMWLEQLFSRLRDHGLLVINFESVAQLNAACRILRKACLAESAYAFTKNGYHNAIGVFCKMPIDHKVNEREILRWAAACGMISARYSQRIRDFSVRRIRL